MKLKRLGDRVFFGKRSGRVIGHTIVKGISSRDEYETYYIVDLDPEARGYLSVGHQLPYHLDCFISTMLVHVDNVGREVS